MASALRPSDAADVRPQDSALRALPRVATMAEAWYHPGALGTTSLGFAGRIGLSQVSRWSLQLVTPGTESEPLVRPPINYWPWASPQPADSAAPVVHRGLPRTLIRRGGVGGPGAFVANLRPEIVDPGQVGSASPSTSRGSAAQPNNGMLAFKRMLERTGRIEPSAESAEAGTARPGELGGGFSTAAPANGWTSARSTLPSSAIGAARERPLGTHPQPSDAVVRRSHPNRAVVAGNAATPSSATPALDMGQRRPERGPAAMALALDRSVRGVPDLPGSSGNGRPVRERSSASLLDSVSSPVGEPFDQSATAVTPPSSQPAGADRRSELWTVAPPNAVTPAPLMDPGSAPGNPPASSPTAQHSPIGPTPPPTLRAAPTPPGAVGQASATPAIRRDASPGDARRIDRSVEASETTRPIATQRPELGSSVVTGASPQITPRSASSAVADAGVRPPLTSIERPADVMPSTTIPEARSATAASATPRSAMTGSAPAVPLVPGSPTFPLDRGQPRQQVDRRLAAASALTEAQSSPVSPDAPTGHSRPGPIQPPVTDAAGSLRRDLGRSGESRTPGRVTSAPVPQPEPAEAFHAVLRSSPSIAPRPLPAPLRPLAAAIVGHSVVSMRTDHVARRALAAAGKRAATTGSVIHFQRSPDPHADRALVAHELAHVAHRSPLPRFFDDDRPSAEERHADDIARLVQRSPILTRPPLPVLDHSAPRRAAESGRPTSPPAVTHERSSAAGPTVRRSSRPAPFIPGSTVTAAELVRRLDDPSTQPATQPATTSTSAPTGGAARPARSPRPKPMVAPAAVIRRSPAPSIADDRTSSAQSPSRPASRSTGAVAAGSALAAETIRRSSLPVTTRSSPASSTSPIIRRVIDAPGGAVELADGGGAASTGAASDAFTENIADLRSASGAVDFVDWIMDQIEDRLLSELQRRGGRFRGEF